MRICLLTEGSYPYVVGGVSSWCQMLMQGLPEHEFFVYSVAAESKDKGAFKYKLPANLKGIQEEFLDDILNQYCHGMKENILTAEEKEVLYDLSAEFGVDDLRVELDCIEPTRFVGDGRKGAAGA